MLAQLLLLLCLTRPVLSTELPDVDCLVVHLQYVQCYWNKLGTPQSNYTFSAWFHNKKTNIECINYLTEKGTTVGCSQPYVAKDDRFSTFYTTLGHGKLSRTQEHDLLKKVKLNPPTNLTVQNGSDSNLWVYWNQTAQNCVESELRYRVDDKEWQITKVGIGKQNDCINLPCSHCRYEVQVHSRIHHNCGQSNFWSNWSETAVWGFNYTDPDRNRSKSVWTSVWTPLLTVVGAITLILLVLMLLHHERIRIILIPVVPKPDLPYDIQDWFEHSKGLKESFKPNYNERACAVREYTPVSQSDSESLGSSTCSVTTDQTDCSVFIPADESDPAPLPAPQI